MLFAVDVISAGYDAFCRWRCVCFCVRCIYSARHVNVEFAGIHDDDWRVQMVWWMRRDRWQNAYEMIALIAVVDDELNNADVNKVLFTDERSEYVNTKNIVVGMRWIKLERTMSTWLRCSEKLSKICSNRMSMLFFGTKNITRNDECDDVSLLRSLRKKRFCLRCTVYWSAGRQIESNSQNRDGEKFSEIDLCFSL